MSSIPNDEPDSFLNFGKFWRNLRNDDLINQVKDLDAKAEKLKKSVALSETDDEYYLL